MEEKINECFRNIQCKYNYTTFVRAIDSIIQVYADPRSLGGQYTIMIYSKNKKLVYGLNVGIERYNYINGVGSIYLTEEDLCIVYNSLLYFIEMVDIRFYYHGSRVLCDHDMWERLNN